MRKVSVYLDEDIRPLLAKILRDRGYDVISSVEQKIFGLSDEEQLVIAIKQKRAILTHNIPSILLKRLTKLLSTSENLKGMLIWLSDYKSP